MIKIESVTKCFGDVCSLDEVALQIPDGSIFGLIGSNGSGKSTLLRAMSGIFSVEEGGILYDGVDIWENTEQKAKLVYLSDEPYFLPHSSIEDMRNLFSSLYSTFDNEKFDKLLNLFGLPLRRKINTFSKGMQKQTSVLLGLSVCPKYLFCDETFDGLDPIMRQSIKSLFAGEIAERGLTPIIASRNLREQEDICEHVGILHKGNIVLSKDLLELKCTIQKIECAFSNEEDAKNCLAQLDITASTRKGPLHLLTVKGDREEVMKILSQYQTTYLEIIPLTLEEIFITEMEAIGYDIKTLIMD